MRLLPFMLKAFSEEWSGAPRKEAGPPVHLVLSSEVPLAVLPRGAHLVAGKRIPRCETLGKQRPIELLNGNPVWRENRALIGSPIGRDRRAVLVEP